LIEFNNGVSKGSFRVSERNIGGEGAN
jgi:hypothetical protein